MSDIYSLKMHILAPVLVAMLISSAVADSSDPRLAGYYNDFLALCGNQVYEWSDTDVPQKSIAGVKQVGIGKHNRYALTNQSELLVWNDDPDKATVVMQQVSVFHAGRSGLFVIAENRSLWKIETQSLLGFGEDISNQATHIADNIRSASVGDSANYYVSVDGNLFVQGRAHRGQYGDGKLTSTEHYVKTSENVIQVASHTGHALILKQDGSVWGTGGNIYGPLGSHGYGDKATRWGRIFEGASAIATGSSHSLAIKIDRSLWIWGRDEGLQPKQVMTAVSAVAAGNRSTIALSQGALWQWNTGDQPKMIMKCEH